MTKMSPNVGNVLYVQTAMEDCTELCVKREFWMTWRSVELNTSMFTVWITFLSKWQTQHLLDTATARELIAGPRWVHDQRYIHTCNYKILYKIKYLTSYIYKWSGCRKSLSHRGRWRSVQSWRTLPGPVIYIYFQFNPQSPTVIFI